MKRLCDLVLLLLTLCLLGSLLGCSSKGKTEAEIRADIPSDFFNAADPHIFGQRR